MRFISPRLICRISFSLIAAVLCLTGPIAEAGQTPNSITGIRSVDSTLPSNILTDGTAPEARMKIGPGDLIEVNVFDEPDLKQSVRLNDLGDGTFSFIGSLHLAGLTTDQAGERIARKLKEGNYLLAPQVAVFIREYCTPGVYGVAGGQSLLDVLAAAGGTTPLAGSEITVQRAGDSSTLTVVLSKDAN